MSRQISEFNFNVFLDLGIVHTNEVIVYRASHIILYYLQSLTPKYAHNT